MNIILEAKQTIIRSKLNGKALPFHPDADYIIKVTEQNIEKQKLRLIRTTSIHQTH